MMDFFDLLPFCSEIFIDDLLKENAVDDKENLIDDGKDILHLDNNNINIVDLDISDVRIADNYEIDCSEIKDNETIEFPNENFKYIKIN